MARIEGVRGPGGRYRPQVNIDLVIRKKKLTLTALVDSGADRTIVPRGVVEALGVDYDKLPAVTDEDGAVVTGSGAGGQFELKECRGKVRWHVQTVCESFWVGPNDAVPWVLLGRDDFFKKFDVRFQWSEEPPVMEITSPSS